jgi:hypothetical protein
MASFAEYTKKKKKQNIEGGSFEDYTRSLLGDDYIEADIAPVRTTVGKTDKKDDKKDKDDSKLDFFQKGAFEDGFDWSDIPKTILGTAGDAVVGIAKGGASLAEGITDAGRYTVAGIADKLGNDDYAEKVRKKAQKNSVENMFKGTDEYLDQYSVLGRTSDAVMQGIGQVGSIILTGGVAGALGAGAVGATVATSGLMGLSSAGSGMSEAYEGGATDKEATIYGISKGIIDAGSELIFGGLGKAVNAVGLSKGISSLDDVFAQKLSGKLSNQVAKNFAEFGVKASAEGFEEVIAGLGTAVAKKLTYMDEEELGQIVKDENLLEQFVVGTVTSGMIQSGYIPGTKEGSLKESNETGKDFITGYTQNEQAVIDKEVENRIKAKETEGKKLTNKQITAIEEEVKKDLDKGYISIDTIESTLGGETYNKYKSLTEQEETLTKKLEELKNAPNTVGNAKQYEETQKQLEELKSKDEKTQIKEQLSKEVKEMTLTDRLSESYNEKSRRSQVFEADLTKYDAKQQEVIKKATESGILNNTNRTHEFVDMVAKISADKGVSFDFTNNAKLKETGFALEGKTVNGYVKDGNIAVNIDSAKALNTVVGHEITHVLEGADLYTELQNVVKEFATQKGEYQTRYDALAELYKDVDGAVIENELTADLVGEYLFTDSDFVSRLSVEKPNIFQKIYEEIKYLAKLVTGSKEARELEKVKRAFDKAYKESANTKADGTKFSLSEDNKGNKLTEEQKNFYKDNHEVFYENGKLKQYYHGTDEAGFFVFDPSKSDDGLSLFVTDNVDVSSTYMDAGTDHEFNPYHPLKEVNTIEDLKDRVEHLGYEVKHEDGKYTVFDPVDEEFYSFSGDTPSDAYNSYLESMEYGEDADASRYYALYVHSTNPLVVDGKNGNWNKIEFNGETKTTRELAKYAHDNGYDSLVINNVHDNGQYSNYGDNTGASQVVVVFDSNQLKSVYNTNPTTDADIRHSLGEQSAKAGDYRVYGKDIALEVSENSTIEENSTVQQEDSDYSEESWNNLLDVAEADPIRESEEMTEAPVDETQVLYSLEEQQQQKIAEVDNVVESEETADTPELTVNESYNAKLGNYRTALEGYKTAKTTIETAFDTAINKKTAEYNALKRKDTQKATTLLTQIENLKLRKSNNVTSIDSKIGRVENTINNMVQNEAQWKQKKLASRRVDYHKGIVDNFKNVFKSKGFDFDKVLEKAKNKGTFASVDNTPQRFIEKTLGYKAGQILNDLTVNKVAQNESKAIKWLNSYTDKKSGLLAQISKEYGIKPRSKESASAQMYAEGFWVDDDGNFIKYGDAELAQDYPNAKVRENIKRLAKDPRIRKIYDETLDMINASRTRNLYPEIPRRNNYFLHFREMDDTFSKLGIPFNPNDIRLKDLPTDINGMTADLKPGQPYFASAMHRMGYKTTYDLVGGVERYLNSAKNQIYHIDDIQTLRALRNYIADTYGQAKGLESLDSMTEEEAVARIQDVYNSHLSTFAKFLNEEANILAGKTTLGDRAVESWFGRRTIQFLDTVNRQVGSNMVGGNISSALTNTVSMVQAVAKSNKFDATKAFAQTVTNKLGSIIGKTDGFVENNPMMIRRKGIEKLTKTPWESITDKGYLLMSAIDNVSSEFIARTKYNELTRKGMSEQQAHIEADKWASRILGDRSLGQQPQLYNSKMLGLVTKFQLEVRNQLDSQFYDTIQEAKLSNEQIENRLVRNMKTSAKVGSTLFQLAVLQHMFGQAFESVAGYNPAFDIVEALVQMFGFDDDEESEDTVLDNLEEGFLTLLGDLPYTSTFTGGRIPISSALPIEQFVTGKDSYGNEKSRWETIKETAPYYLAPTGYGQFKKTKQGLEMFSDEHPVAGSYTDSGNLRFPIEDTPLNRVQAGIFGQYASENARDYFDNERNPLKEKQIQEYKDLEMPIKEYWEYREGLSKHDKLADKADYIASLDLPISKKNIMINNIADRKEAIDMTNYDDFSSFEEFDYATKNPEKYAFSKAVGGYSAYKSYQEALSDISADKDENGKTINGSRKEKVLNYINGLDADYYEKIILFKSEYNADDTYNEEIIEYLNNRSDISYEEEVEILKGLGFEVDADGNIYW